MPNRSVRLAPEALGMALVPAAPAIGCERCAGIVPDDPLTSSANFFAIAEIAARSKSSRAPPPLPLDLWTSAPLPPPLPLPDFGRGSVALEYCVLAAPRGAAAPAPGFLMSSADFRR
jgi:hypothetical protein